MRDALEVADDHFQEDELFAAAATGAPLGLVLEHLSREMGYNQCSAHT